MQTMTTNPWQVASTVSYSNSAVTLPAVPVEIIPPDLEAALTELHQAWTAGSHTQGEIDDLTDDVVGLFAQYKGAVS
jgi:hypothetical protein